MRSAFLVALALVACNPDAKTDSDLDGVTADLDCNDLDDTVGAPSVWHLDGDADGWAPEGAETVVECYRPEGYARRVGDCDDAEPLINPSVAESCNAIDDDCDGFVDENTGTGVWYADLDADGFGDPNTEVDSCDGSGGLVSNNRDCDDANAAVRPGADELCDGIDNDCDARIDEEDAFDAKNWYRDRDEDGFGIDSTAVRSCDAPGEGWSDIGGDCNDVETDVNPDADELCDGFDNDCDGKIDGGDAADAVAWYPDNDRDGYGDDASVVNSCFEIDGYVSVGGDCDDRNRYLSPETLWFADVDEDGYGDATSTMASCTDPSTSTDIYVDNLRDCDDEDDTISPAATEVCDGIDNDCDGSADGADATGAKTFYMDYDGDGFGDPGRTGKACDAPEGFTTDSADCNDDNRYVNPDAVEFCDGIDNDCDKLIDYSDPDVTSPTWYLDADDDGWGRGDVSTVQCEQPEGYVLDDGDCMDGNEDVHPGAKEVCDAGLDNDCDGLVDGADPDMSGDGTWYRDSDGDSYGDSDLTVVTCSEPAGYVRNDDDCDDSDASRGLPVDCWDAPVTFTTCGKAGPDGPSQSQCDSAYSGTDLDGIITVTGGKQKWVVPFDGTFRIDAYGAGGGNTTYSGYSTGKSKGARMRGDFDLEKGDVIWIGVGQQGVSAYYAGGGGGGSYVVDDAANALVVAGGGGGVYYFAGYYSSGRSGCPGVTSSYGGTGATYTTDSCPTKSSGLGQGGSSYSSVAAGGGGMTTSGGTDTRGDEGGRGWKQGAGGGRSAATTSSYLAHGGFGGGGSTWYGGGGGGGYTGGDGQYRGGGGGSFNDGANPSNAGNTNTGDGKVVIDYVGD